MTAMRMIIIATAVITIITFFFGLYDDDGDDCYDVDYSRRFRMAVIAMIMVGMMIEYLIDMLVLIG